MVYLDSQMHWQKCLCMSVYLYCVTQFIWLLLPLVKYHAEQWNNCFINRNQPAFLSNCLPLFRANYLWLNLCEILLTGPHSFIVAVSLSFSDVSISLYSGLVQTWQFEHKQPEVLISLSHTALFPRKPVQASLYRTLCPPHLPQLQPFPQAHFYLFARSPLHLRDYLRIKHLLADFLSPSKSISPEAMSVSLLSQ